MRCQSDDPQLSCGFWEGTCASDSGANAVAPRNAEAAPYNERLLDTLLMKTNRNRLVGGALAVAMGLLLPATLWGQDLPQSVLKGVPGEQTPAPQPAEVSKEPIQYRSVEHGVQVMMPPGQLVQSGDPETLATVVNPDTGWRFELRKVSLNTPAQLRTIELNTGGQRVGLLDMLAQDTVSKLEEANELRRSMIPLGDADAGLFIIHHLNGQLAFLQQMALIQATPRLYYQLSLLSPAPKDVDKLSEDENTAKAIEAFQSAIDSFSTVDQTALLEDQQRRLVETRALFVNLTSPGRIGRATMPEQWLRLRKDGKEIGYVQRLEQPADSLPNLESREKAQPGDPTTSDGVRIGQRTVFRTDGGDVRRLSWSFSTNDMARSDFREWSLLEDPNAQEDVNNPLNQGPAPVTQALMVGQVRERYVPQRTANPAFPAVEREEFVSRRRLTVTLSVDGLPQSDQTVQELPVFYVPQAIELMLPKLVAPWGEKEYMVAVYAPQKREVWSQYIDVSGARELPVPDGSAEQVTRENRVVITVKIKLGVSGDVTTHYIDAESYHWLGSVNEDTGIEVLPTNLETLQKLWQGSVEDEDMVENAESQEEQQPQDQPQSFDK